MKPTQAVCKFTCTWTKTGEPGAPPTHHLEARYDPTLPEDQRFNKATPWGEMTFGLSNAALDGFFTPGRSYYVTLTPAD